MTDLTQDIADAAFRYLDGNMMLVYCIDGTPLDVQAVSDSIARDVAAVVEAHLRPVVTTVAELDALPDGTVIRTGDVYGHVLQREGSAWYSPGEEVGDIAPNLPATVLYRPAD